MNCIPFILKSIQMDIIVRSSRFMLPIKCDDEDDDDSSNNNNNAILHILIYYLLPFFSQYCIL